MLTGVDPVMFALCCSVEVRNTVAGVWDSHSRHDHAGRHHESLSKWVYWHCRACLCATRVHHCRRLESMWRRVQAAEVRAALALLLLGILFESA